MNSNLVDISRLEEKLAEYEEKIPITDDEELLCALNTIIEEQNALPPEEKDAPLLNEAVNAALSLRGEDLAGLEKRSREIATKNIATKRKKHPSSPLIVRLGRHGIAIAAALTVIIMTSVIGFTAGLDWISELYMRIMNLDDGEVIVANESREYESIEAMVDELGVSGVLLPHTLPDGMEIQMITSQISYAKPIEGEEAVYSCMFDIRTSGDGSWQEVWIETENIGTTAEGETREIGGREVTYYLDGARHCAFFCHDGYTYSVSATEYSELEAMLKALK